MRSQFGFSLSPSDQLAHQMGQIRLSGSPMAQSPEFSPPSLSPTSLPTTPLGLTPLPGPMALGTPSHLSIFQNANRDGPQMGQMPLPSGTALGQLPAGSPMQLLSPTLGISPIQLPAPDQTLPSPMAVGTLPKPTLSSSPISAPNPLTGRPEPRKVLSPKSLDFSLTDTLQLPSTASQPKSPNWGPYLGEVTPRSALAPGPSTCLIPSGSGFVKTIVGYNPQVELTTYGVNPNRKAFFGNIERIAVDNSMFRKVIFTSTKEQLVVMALQPQENIGMEVHPATDQFFRIEQGNGVFLVGDGKGGVEPIPFQAGDSFQVPAGTQHDVFASTEVKLYTIYSPPQHPMDTIDITKDDARIREI